MHDVVSRLPRDFSLADVLRQRQRFEREFPNNPFVDAKIRQSLQVLRDQGALRFVTPGHYQRLDVPPVFSPLIDMAVTSRFVSAAQAARVALETWASFNLYCLNCERDELDQLPDNTPVADFACAVCKSRYQLKGKNGRLGKKSPGLPTGRQSTPFAPVACRNTSWSSSIRDSRLWSLSTRFRVGSSPKSESRRENRFRRTRGAPGGADATLSSRVSTLCGS